MHIQSSNYIPVHKLSRNEIVSEIIKQTEEQIVCHKKIIENNEKMIKGGEKIIENNKKGIALIEGFFAKYFPQEDLSPSALKKANTAYVSANKLLDVTHTAKTYYEKKEVSKISNTTEQNGTQNQLLEKADILLQAGRTSQALQHYNKVLLERENNPISEEYKPVEEKLRQAARLYTDLQPLVENLRLYKATEQDIYSTAIAAHTQGTFALSKSEVLHMIKNQFFYPVQ